MKIDQIKISNFRSIKNETINCRDLTALVGTNGSGKSSFLIAIKLFYDQSPKVSEDDFYDRDTSGNIEISITYRDLSAEAKEHFSSYLQKNMLSVTKIMSINDGKLTSKYHGSKLANPDFIVVRNASSAKDKKSKYVELLSGQKYKDMQAWKNQNQAMQELDDWENKNIDTLNWVRDDGQFFGFKEVAQGYLGRFTRFIFIPAVRDASGDASESKGSILTDLMDLVVRSVLANKDDVKKLKDETQQRYEKILNPSKLTELNTLSERLSETLKTFVPEAGINLEWQSLDQVIIPLPKADIKLVEDNFKANVDKTGHGLQRAFIMTLLQHLALAQSNQTNEGDRGGKKDEFEKLPNIVLAIEEPELYQHPNRQRHIAKILAKLASGETPGVAKSTQLFYGTHSPFFVGIDRIDKIRLLRKVNPPESGKPKVTSVIQTTLEKVADSIWKANGEKGEIFTEETIIPRLKSVMTPWMSEGFFANTVVLVEGEDDKAAISGAAKVLNHNFDALGISVIPCNGKTNIDRPYVIFNQLGIPVYVIWDSDKNDQQAKPENNHRLLRLVGAQVEDWPNGVFDTYACFEKDLEKTICAEIGEDNYMCWLDECRDAFCIPKIKHAVKNPMVVRRILEHANSCGLECQTLNNIIDKIIKLNNSNTK